MGLGDGALHFGQAPGCPVYNNKSVILVWGFRLGPEYRVDVGKLDSEAPGSSELHRVVRS